MSLKKQDSVPIRITATVLGNRHAIEKPEMKPG
jgi:hypothetical protein